MQSGQELCAGPPSQTVAVLKMPDLQGIVLPGVKAKERTTVAGQVIGPDGKPMPGAPVAVTACVSRPGKIEWLPLVRGATDSQGRFRLVTRPLSPPEDRNLTVYALAPGYAVSWKHLDTYRSANAATLSLQHDQRIRGRVVDSRGKPVAGIEVALLAADLGYVREEARWYQLEFPTDPSALKPASVVTDEKGQCVLRGISSMLPTFRIGINDRRYAPQQLEVNTNAKESGDITLTATPPQTIEGTLLDAAGRTPVAGAEVIVTSLVSTGGPFMLRGLAQGQTDSRGNFRLTPYVGQKFVVGVVDSDNRFLRLLLWKSAEEVLGQKLKMILPEGATVRTATDESVKGVSASVAAQSSDSPNGVNVIGRAVGPEGQVVAKGFVLGAAFLPLGDRWGTEFPPIRDGWFAVQGL
jgi:protocatechuate 3,4-dioxygenase beta subunit